MIRTNCLRRLSLSLVALGTTFFIGATLPIAAIAQDEAAADAGADSPESNQTESKQEEALPDAPPAPDVEVSPDAKAGPPADSEKADFQTMKFVRMGRQLDPKNRVNSRIARYMAAAIEKQDEDGPEESIRLLKKLNPKRLNRMERASVARVEALLFYTTGDMDKTIDAFRRSLREETLPLDAEAMMRFQIAQLQAGKYQWQAAIDAIYEWFRYTEDEENPLAYYLLGIANFQLGNLDLAIVNTEEALKIAGQPNQGWLQLLAAVYVQKLNYPKAARALEKLVINFPKKQYWVQLGLVYGAMDNYQEQLAVQQVAYQQGFLTEEADLRRLARSYLYADLPYPAARVLESGLADGSIESAAKSLELLANSWIAAREYEKSLPPLVEAATVSPDGNLFVRLGQVFLQRENWAGAAARLEDAREKGGLTNPGNVSLLLGIAYYNNNQLFLAKSSFIEAAEHEKTKEDAERWIDHIKTETKSTS